MSVIEFGKAMEASIAKDRAEFNRQLFGQGFVRIGEWNARTIKQITLQSGPKFS